MSKPRSKTNNLTWSLKGPKDNKFWLGRWNPGPAIRAKGYKGVDLWADGIAYTLEECKDKGFNELVELNHRGSKPLAPSLAIQLAEQLNAIALATPTKTQAEEEKKPNTTRSVVARPRVKTMNDLFTDYLDSDEFKAKGPSTRQGYESSIKHLRIVYGPERPKHVTAELIEEVFRTDRDARGHTTAHYAYVVLRLVLNWGHTKNRWASYLPARDTFNQLGLPKPAGRIRVAFPAELNAMMRAFDDPASIYDELDLPQAERVLRPRRSGGDALIMMLWTACRVQTSLTMIEDAYENGTIVFRPTKTAKTTGVILEIPVLGALKQRLPEMIRRKRAIFQDVAPFRELIIDETLKKPYWRQSKKSGIRQHKRFNDLWRERRALAGRIEPRLIGATTDRLGDTVPELNAQDLRDTAITRLTNAGADLWQLCAWHGSNPEHMTQLAQHYIQIGESHAAQAGEKLVKMVNAQGIDY